MPNKTTCCEKCREEDGEIAQFCITRVCPCHQSESIEWEKEAEDGIIDKVQDCVYGLNLNVTGEKYEEILWQIKGSIWLRGEIRRILSQAITTAVAKRDAACASQFQSIRDAEREHYRAALAAREKELVEEVERLPEMPGSHSEHEAYLIDRADVLSILKH